ncbi:hypothetical protein B7463_g11005, partial [Scytalidium lignicola]
MLAPKNPQFSRGTFLGIMAAWHFPNSLFRVANDYYPLSTIFTVPDVDEMDKGVVILFENSSDIIDREMVNINERSLMEMEIQTGMNNFNARHSVDPSKLDLEALTRDLTSLTSCIGNTEIICKHELRCFETLTQLCQKLAPKMDGGSSSLQAQMEERIKLLSQRTHSMLDLTTSHEKRIGAQIQTIYSLLSQRDNKQNIAIAEASRNIAENTFNDSYEMRRIAMHARRDSIDMRVIAAVTLIFLPGTFTATLFSTTFFNFSSAPNPKVVSHWVWLYWVVTVSLTLVVLGAWVFVSRVLNERGQNSISGQLPAPENADASSGSYQTCSASQPDPMDLSTDGEHPHICQPNRRSHDEHWGFTARGQQYRCTVAPAPCLETLRKRTELKTHLSNVSSTIRSEDEILRQYVEKGVGPY